MGELRDRLPKDAGDLRVGIYHAVESPNLNDSIFYVSVWGGLA